MTMLDCDEYLHLAAHASATGDHHACLTYLHEALRQRPREARALHLLAAEHAELGLHVRAIEELRTALDIDPDLHLARLQLGLLLIDRDRAKAREQFSTLRSAPDANLHIFAEALVAWADGDVAAARNKLSIGLAQSPVSPLSRLMQRILDTLSGTQSVTAPPVEVAARTSANAQDPAFEQRINLGAYGRSPT